MSSNVQQYSLMYARVGSALLSEEGQVTLERMSGAQIVLTVAKGFAGLSPGAQMCRGRVVNAIPATGLEYDAGPAIEAMQPVEIGIRNSAGQEATIQGFIPSDTVSHGVNQEARYEFEFFGIFPQWK